MLNYIRNLISKKDHSDVFILFGICFCISLMLMINSLTFEFVQGYYFTLALLYIEIIIYFIFLIWNVFKSKKIFKFPINIIFLISILFLFLAILFYSEYRIEGSHDNGVYFENALLIANNKGYGINDLFVSTYPGFLISKNHIASKFPPGYSTYLSIFTFLGDKGIPISNLILVVLSLVTIYFIIKELRGEIKIWLTFSLLFLLNFYSIYFLRSTYSESLQLFIIWFSILCMLKGVNSNKYLTFGLIPISLLLFVRAEGVFNLILYLIVFFYIKIFKSNGQKGHVNKYNKVIIFYLIIFLFIYLSYNYFVFNYFSLNFGNILSYFSESSDLSQSRLGISPILINSYYVFKIISSMGFIVMALLGLSYLFKNNGNYKIYLPLIITAPQLAYIFSAGIAFYLPWFMRRLWPVLIIMILLYFSFFISHNRQNKKILSLIIAIIFIINLIFSAQIMFAQEKGPGNKVINKFNDLCISGNYLIFLDRFGIEPYGPPLYFKENCKVVYDRLPMYGESLYSYILNDTNKKIFIITSSSPENNLTFFYTSLGDNNLIYESNYNLSYNSQGCNIRDNIVNPETFTHLSIIDLSCKLANPPTNIVEAEKRLYVYEIDNLFNNSTKNLKDIEELLILDLHQEEESYKK